MPVSQIGTTSLIAMQGNKKTRQQDDILTIYLIMFGVTDPSCSWASYTIKSTKLYKYIECRDLAVFVAPRISLRCCHRACIAI